MPGWTDPEPPPDTSRCVSAGDRGVGQASMSVFASQADTPISSRPPVTWRSPPPR